MIDINELRRLAQAATPGPDGVSLSWIRLLQDFQQGANPATISELLDRLESAEKDIALKERVIDSLGSELNAVANERDTLRAKVEAMERQRPVRLVFKSDELDEQIKLATDPIWAEAFEVPEGMVPLYALPGAQPAPTELVGARKVTRDFRWDAATQCHVPTLKVEFEPVHIDEPSDAKGWQDQDRIAAMLEAAPGAQPAPSMPDLLESLRCACNYIDKLGGVSQQYRAMLASPEAKS